MTTQRIANALLSILEIGKRNTTNPKYDPHYNEARAALYEATQPTGIHGANILGGGSAAEPVVSTPAAITLDQLIEFLDGMVYRPRSGSKIVSSYIDNADLRAELETAVARINAHFLGS